MSDTNLIDPSKFPSVELDPGLVSTVAGLLSDLSTRVSGSASAIGSSWSTLPVSYVSTGSEAIYTGMDPVVGAASSLSSGVSSVSAALDQWVSDVLPIKIAFDALADQAATFRHQALHFQGTWELQGSNLWADSWDQDQKMVDKNNTLLGKSYVLADRLRVANETLANAIRAAAGLKTEKVTPAVKSAPDGVQTAWGSANGVQESCAGKVIGFPKDVTLGFLGGAGNMLSGLGQLLTGYDFKSWPPPSIAVTQLLLSGDYTGAQATMNAYLGGWGQAWVGMGHLVTGLAMGVTGPLMTEVIMPGQIDQLKKAGADTSVLEGMQQWERDSYTSYVDLFGSFVGYHAPTEWWKATPEEWGAGWSDWADNPGQTLGSSAFNIASVIVPVPGVGEISAALKGGAAGAEDALRVAGDASSAAAHAADAAAGAGRVDLDAARLATGEIDPAARLGALTDDLARAGSAGDRLAGTVHDTGLGTLGTDLSTRLDHVDRIHADAPPAPSHPTGGDPTPSAERAAEHGPADDRVPATAFKAEHASATPARSGADEPALVGAGSKSSAEASVGTDRPLDMGASAGQAGRFGDHAGSGGDVLTHLHDSTTAGHHTGDVGSHTTSAGDLGHGSGASHDSTPLSGHDGAGGHQGSTDHGGSSSADGPPAQPWEPVPHYNEPSDPVVWRDDDEGVALTASDKVIADDYLSHAHSAEPALTSLIQDLAARHPGSHPVGLGFRLKDDASFYRKAASDYLDEVEPDFTPDMQQIVDQVKDAVRYTIETPDATYVSATRAMIRQLQNEGYAPLSMRNAWGGSGYEGLNTTWRAPDGQAFEVQFHTPESWHAKSETHDLYKEQRAPNTSPERFDELQRLQNEIFDRVTPPEGADQIGWE